MTIFIAGAGMAGLLAANMLRSHQPLVMEKQRGLPNNHHAVLRFRTDAVSRELGIPFRKVRVFKSIDEADPIKAGVRYSYKVLGKYEMRSALNLEPADRFIAPSDLIARMAMHGIIRYGIDPFTDGNVNNHPLISTIPMEALMDALDYPGPRPKFESIPGWTCTGTIEGADLFVTRYVTDLAKPWYRASITGDKLIIEGTGEAPDDPDYDPNDDPNDDPLFAALELGIRYRDEVTNVQTHASRYAKIAAMSPEDRRKADDFMFWATHEHNIYSLGRFATWRPGLLLDDLVQDVRKIERWIDSPRYEVQRAR